MEDIIIAGFGIIIFGSWAIYSWLLVRKIQKFTQYHPAIKNKKNSIPTYVLFLASLGGLVISSLKLVMAFL